jgi:preprotein translocase subunit YajC
MKSYRSAVLVLVGAMSLFAQAAPAAKGQQGSMQFLLMMGVIFAIIYFLMIMPQKKKQKETQNMLSNVKKGDKIVTIGGMIGTIGNVKDHTFMIKIADNTVVEYRKSAIAALLNDDGSEIVPQKGAKGEKKTDDAGKKD